jgi:hypothetical protein
LLNCFILGDKPNETVKPNETFPVEVLKTKTIGILKKMIKEEKAHRLKHVDASDLILTKVSLSVDDHLGENLKGVELTPLNPVLPLSQVFPRVEENRLHLVVHAPHQGEPISVVLHVTEDIVDIVQRAWASRTRKKRGETRSLLWIKVRIFFPFFPSLIQNVISRISKAMPPADSAKSSNYTKSQPILPE